MIKRSLSKVNGSVVNAQVQNDTLTCIKGIHCENSVAEPNSCVDSVNFKSENDGTYKLRDVVVKKTDAGVVAFFLNKTGYELVFSYGSGAYANNLYVSVRDQDGGWHNVTLRYVKTDHTIGTSQLASSVNGLFEDISNVEALNAGDILLLTHVKINLADSKVPGIYDPDLMSNTHVYRYVAVYQDTETDDWIMYIVSPEENTIPDTSTSWSYDVNLLLDNIYSLTDLYDYGANSIKGVVAYKKKTGASAVSSTAFTRECYVDVSDVMFDCKLTNDTYSSGDYRKVVVSTHHHILTSYAYKALQKAISDKDPSKIVLDHDTFRPMDRSLVSIIFYNNACSFEYDQYGGSKVKPIGASTNAKCWIVSLRVILPAIMPAGTNIIDLDLKDLAALSSGSLLGLAEYSWNGSSWSYSTARDPSYITTIMRTIIACSVDIPFDSTFYAIDKSKSIESWDDLVSATMVYPNSVYSPVYSSGYVIRVFALEDVTGYPQFSNTCIWPEWKKHFDTNLSGDNITFVLKNSVKSSYGCYYPYVDVWFGKPNTTINAVNYYCEEDVSVGSIRIRPTEDSFSSGGQDAKYFKFSFTMISEGSGCFIHDVMNNTFKVKDLTEAVTNAKFEMLSTLKTEDNSPLVLKALITTIAPKDLCNYFAIWEESSDGGITWNASKEYIIQHRDKIKYLPQLDYYGKETLTDSYGYVKYMPFVQFIPGSKEDLCKDRPDVLYIRNNDVSKKYRFRIVYYQPESGYSYSSNANNCTIEMAYTPPCSTDVETTYHEELETMLHRDKDGYIASNGVSLWTRNDTVSNGSYTGYRHFIDTYVVVKYKFQSSTSVSDATAFANDMSLMYGYNSNLTKDIMCSACIEKASLYKVLNVSGNEYAFIYSVRLGVDEEYENNSLCINYAFYWMDSNNAIFAHCKCLFMHYGCFYGCTARTFYGRKSANYWENAFLMFANPTEIELKSENISITNVNKGPDSDGYSSTNYENVTLSDILDLKVLGSGTGGAGYSGGAPMYTVDEDGFGPFTSADKPNTISFSQTFVINNKNNVPMPVRVGVFHPGITYRMFATYYKSTEFVTIKELKNGSLTLRVGDVSKTVGLERSFTNYSGGSVSGVSFKSHLKYSVACSEDPTLTVNVPANSSVTVSLTYNMQVTIIHTGEYRAPTTQDPDRSITFTDEEVSLKWSFDTWMFLPYVKSLCNTAVVLQSLVKGGKYPYNSVYPENFIKVGAFDSYYTGDAYVPAVFDQESALFDQVYAPGTTLRWLYDEAYYGPTYAQNAIVVDMSGSYQIPTDVETKTLENKRIPLIESGKTFFRYGKIFTYGVKGYENAIFTSASDSYITYMSGMIDIPSGNKVTKLIGWRNYILAFTDTDINLITYDASSNTFSVKIINNTVGVSELDADTVVSVLNMIVFKSQNVVYKLVPNVYSDVDNIFNTVILSDPIEEQLSHNIDDTFNNFAVATEKDYWLFCKSLYENKSYVFKFGLSDKTWNIFTYDKIFGSAEYTRLNEFFVYNPKNIAGHRTYTRYIFDKPLKKILETAYIIGLAAYDDSGFYCVAAGVDSELGILPLATEYEMEAQPNKTEVYQYLPYGDYFDKTPHELITFLSANPEVLLSDVTEFPFKIDFGQKSSKFTIDKQFLETKFVFGSLSERDLFPVTLDLSTDGYDKPLHLDVHTDSALQKTQFGLRENTTFIGDFGTVGTNFGDGKSVNHGILRQMIVKYSGRGKTIRVLITGKSKYDFKFYSLENRYRISAKKQ